MSSFLELRIIIHVIISVMFLSSMLTAQTKRPDNSVFQKLQEENSINIFEESESIAVGTSTEWHQSLMDENRNRLILNENSRQQQEDPEGDVLQRRIFSGLTAGSRFGYSTSSAGDVNGDGYDDIIIGAYSYNTNTGRAYIYFGGPVVSTSVDLILTGGATNNYFGYSVSGAGDVNGDGYSDVIVGAYGYSTNTGRAYIYYGGALMNNVADVVLTGEASSNFFGTSVSSAGDVNGDGYSDVIAGAPNYNSNLGRTYIYYGGSSMNNVVDVTITGTVSGGLFGNSVSGAGDVNSDGFSDVIVGGDGYSSSTGRAYIFYGGSPMNITIDVTLTGAASSNYFGYSVSSAGDLNGDGFSDVIVGAYGYSSFTGRAYAYHGGTSMDATADVTFTGETANDNFGISVASAGDVNGDGFTDILIGAVGYNSLTGRVYAYLGGAVMNNIQDIRIDGEGTSHFFGRFARSAGDFNGDGYHDIIVSAHGYGSNIGRVYFYDYFMKNEIFPNLVMYGEGINSNFGSSVCNAGDVNGDGYDDILVGAFIYNNYVGRAYIYFGGPNMDNAADVVFNAIDSGSYFGSRLSGAGDVNSDGFDDVMISASNYNSGRGRVYLYLGGATMDNVADVIMTGEAAGNTFGSALSSAGDVNGDGFSDVIISAYVYSSNTGRAYIFYGGSVMNNVADVAMTGYSISNFGYSVSGGGDINADGYNDVIVSATGFDTSKGRVYIFYGGASMNNNPDIVITGEKKSQGLGFILSDAGDVNGDGYSDILVGTDCYGNQYEGTAYIYYGGISMDTIPDVTFYGESIDHCLGRHLSSAGDVNSDGYADIMITSINFDAYSGKVYVFFGSANMDNQADMTMTGPAANTRLGFSLSGAGDLNGDGFGDLLVGGFGFDDYTGRAHVYYGSAISVKPILLSVNDVPYDQGGFVNLKWARSSNDVTGSNLITHYVVERSLPPSGGNFFWVNAGEFAANNNPFYSFISATPYDSSGSSNGRFFYRVTARTSLAAQYWRSAILSGRSIDNIAPMMVSPFYTSSVGSNVKLTWGRNSAHDLLNYLLYRSVSPVIDPETEPIFATTTDSTYLDTSPLSGMYYYFIAAQDIHNNKSSVAVTDAPNISLNLTLFIEGFYNAGSNSQISDTITVELRNQNSPFALADIAKAVAGSNGTADLKFGVAVNGNYYLAVRHRNSIETWSANPVAMSIGSSVNYDFTNSSLQAYGSNVIQIDASPVRFGNYSGDVNQDGIVEGTDGLLIDNHAAIFNTGYLNTDINGDEIIDGSDALTADNNAANFVSAVKP